MASVESSVDGQDSHPQSALEKGVVVQIDDQSVRIPAPTLTGDLNADEQTRRITGLLKGLPYRQFMRDSVVAPVRINLRYIQNDSGKRLGHSVHLLFVVHQGLQSFSADDFAGRLMGQPQEGASSHSTAIAPETLKSLGIEDQERDVDYKRLNFELLDRIQLSGVLRIARTSSDSQNRIDLSLDERFENRWKSTDGRNPDASYSGCRGWLTATSLIGMDAVLIETRFAIHEPTDWFRGDNYLRSKLPLVLQEAARDLRRRLSLADQSRKPKLAP